MRFITLVTLSVLTVFVAACTGQSTTGSPDTCVEGNSADCPENSDVSDSTVSRDASDTSDSEERDTSSSSDSSDDSDAVEQTDTGPDGASDAGGTGGIPGSCEGSTIADYFTAVSLEDTSGFGRIHAAAGPQDGAFLAWQASGQIIVSQRRLDGTEQRRHTFSGDDIYGLAATEAHFALLVYRSPDVLALVVAEHDGTVVDDKTLIGDVDHSVEGNEWFGQGIRAARLTRVGDGWAAYYTVRRLWPDGIAHYGDQIRIFEADGTPKTGGWGWGCSHSMEVRISHNGQRLGPLCASDCYPSKGVHFNHRGGELWSDEQGSNCAGSYATSLGASVPMPDGFWLAFTATDQRDSHDVAIARVTDRSVGTPVWLTEDDVRDSALNAQMYGDELLVAWLADSTSRFALVSDPDGTVSGDPELVPGARLTGSSDFFVYSNGDVGWAQRSDDSGIELARLRLCE